MLFRSKKNLLSAQFRAIHSQPDFDTVLKYLVIDDGCAFVAYDSNKKNITGVAFVIIENNNLLILDMICNDQESQDNLVNQICTKYNVASVKWMSNSNEAGANSYGMIRIINLPRFLDICAAKYFNLQLQLSVFDSIVKNNSGTYTLNDGLCSYSADINNALSIDQVLPFLFKEIEKQCGDKIDAAISLMLE